MADRKSIARKYIEEVFGKGNTEYVDRTLGSGYVCHDPVVGDIDTATFKGWVSGLIKAFPDIKAQISTVIAEGDVAAVQWRLTGTHKGSFVGIGPTNKRVTLDGFSMLRFKDDRIVEEWDQYNLVQLLRQVGTREIPTAGMGAGAYSSQPHA